MIYRLTPYILVRGRLVEHFEKNPWKVPESRLVGVAPNNCNPLEVPGEAICPLYFGSIP